MSRVIDRLFVLNTEPEAEPQSTRLPYIPLYALSASELQSIRRFAACLAIEDQAERDEFPYGFTDTIIRYHGRWSAEPRPPLRNFRDPY